MRNLVNRIGETYNNLEIIAELGGNLVKTKCKVCGVVDIYRKSELINGSIKECKQCKLTNKRVNIGDTKNELTVQSIQKLAAYKGKNEKFNGTQYELVVKCSKCKNISTVPYETFRTKDNVHCSICNTTFSSRLKDRTGEVFGQFKITKELGGGQVKAVCNSCHAESIFIKALLISNKVRCPICGKKSSGYFVSNVGLIKNGLKVIKEITNIDKSISVRLECLNCGTEYMHYKSAFINSLLFCDNCRYDKIDVMCKKCGLKDVVPKVAAQRPYWCRACGEEIKIKDFIELNDKKEFCRSIVKQLKPNEPDAKFLIIDEIIIVNPPKYIGRNGQAYYDAYCMKCNKKLILSRAETKNYDHKLCESNFDMT